LDGSTNEVSKAHHEDDSGPKVTTRSSSDDLIRPFMNEHGFRGTGKGCEGRERRELKLIALVRERREEGEGESAHSESGDDTIACSVNDRFNEVTAPRQRVKG